MTSRRIATVVAGLVFAAFAASAGTKIETTVKPEPGVAPAKKLLVALVSPDFDRRKNWEEIFAGEIGLQGVQVVPSYRLFPEIKKDREAARAKVAAEGIDSVLIVQLSSFESKLKYKESEKSLQPEYLGQDWYGGYWYTYEQIEVAGYVENKSRARFKCDYWRLEGDKDRLVWSAMSDSLAPTIKPEAGIEVITAITKALRKAGLI